MGYRVMGYRVIGPPIFCATWALFAQDSLTTLAKIEIISWRNEKLTVSEVLPYC
jgi:hypothetical protein